MANNITVFGRLGRDAEQKFTPSGSAVLEFSVAEDVGFGDKKTTNWWKVAVWGKQAESKLADYLKKGQQVVVMGEVTHREYETNGTKRMSIEIRAHGVQLAGQKSEGHDAGQQQHAPAQQQQSPQRRPLPNPKPVDEFEDDIPFS